MGPQTISNAAPPQEVDVVVIGGGAAGAVVAGRLAKADPTLQIAVLEHGQNNKDMPTSFSPSFYISHLAPTSTTASFYVSKESKETGGRACIVPTGGVLGGGSSINFMMYTNSCQSDWNDWKTEGWSFEDVHPLARKIETNHVPKLEPGLHGKEGPLHVSYGGHQSELGKEFIKAAEKSNFEVPYVHDLQDYKTGHGITTWAKWINPKTGRRSDTANGYLHPVVETQSNLHVICEAKVIKVLFDDSTPPKAVGVEYCANPLATAPLNPEQPPTVGERLTIKAKKYVVVSAGALGTPGILERSGVGAKDVLEKAGVDVKVDLPGVGAEYQDHQLTLGIYVMDDEADTHDEFLRGNPEVHGKASKEFNESGKGLIATNMIDAGMRMRPTEKELDAMGEDFRTRAWNPIFKDNPDKPVMFGGLVSTFLGDHSLLPPKLKYTMAGAYQMIPLSRGYIHINSADPFAAPDFDAGFLKDAADLPPQIWCFKVLREIMRRMPSYRGELAPVGPKFPEGSAAKCLSPEEAVELHKQDKIEDIVYTKEDDEAIEEWLRQNVGTTWHSMATCPMKAKEAGGVVDARLNVHGTQGLKLADLSICPSNMCSNTYSVALTVGEKAAVLLGEDLGIKV